MCPAKKLAQFSVVQTKSISDVEPGKIRSPVWRDLCTMLQDRYSIQCKL